MAATTVGVRELRQNLSKYLTRIKRGESLVVTERNRGVARLVPIEERGAYEEAARKFGATVPTRRLERLAAELEPRSTAAGATDRHLADGRRERS